MKNFFDQNLLKMIDVNSSVLIHYDLVLNKQCINIDQRRST